MKTAKFGLSGSVTVIGMVYLLALALAPTPGMAAPGVQTSPGTSAGAVGTATTAAVCPYTRYAEHVVNGLIEAHRTKMERPAEMPSMPAWGTGRLTVF